MKNLTPAVLTFLLSPALAFGQVVYTGFQSIRDKALSGASDVPAVPVKFKIVPGPAAEEPEIPPNLGEDQVNALLGRLGEIEGAAQGRQTHTEDHVRRLVIGLVTIDIKFVDPISKERWGAVLKDMGDLAEAEFGKKTSDWDEVVDHMLQKAVSDLKEPHTIYMNPAQSKAFRNSLSGKVSGIGALVSPDPQGLRLDTLLPGSGAEAAGLQDGDLVTHVGGKPVAGLPVDQIVQKLLGEPGTKVLVGVSRGGLAQKPVNVTRRSVAVPNAFSRMAAPGIGYVYFKQFQNETGDKVVSMIEGLRAQGARSVILDVRGNGGGLVTAVALIASEFFKDKEDIVSFKHQGMVAWRAVTDGDGKFASMPVVVLVDKNSASASEILSSAVQDEREGISVIGSRTYGKGTEQTVLPQGQDRSLKITENRWYSPADRSIDASHDKETGMEIPGTGGVVPDLVVDVPEEQSAKVMKEIILRLFGKEVPEPAAQDPVLEKAVEVLSQLKS
jgi:carboxyl-terminal processing protease